MGETPAEYLPFEPDEFLALLFDDEALVGSGTLVELPDGTCAIATARHVVVNLVVAGSFHCVVPGAGWRSLEPTTIRIHYAHDTALVLLSSDVRGGIPWTDWNPTGTAALSGDLLCVGLPGAWKGSVDLARRTIDGMTGLAAWSSTIGTTGIRGRMELRIKETDDLPPTLRGMSGGSVFAPAGRLVGVITHEILDTSGGLVVASLCDSTSLVLPFVPEPGTPQDLMRQVAALVIPVRYRDSRRFPHQPFHIVGVFEHLWSQSDPEYFISRLLAVGSATTAQSRRFVMNTESIFYPQARTLQDQIRECTIELGNLFSTPSMESMAEGPDPSAETLDLMQSMVGRITSARIMTMLVGERA